MSKARHVEGETHVEGEAHVEGQACAERPVWVDVAHGFSPHSVGFGSHVRRSSQSGGLIAAMSVPGPYIPALEISPSLSS